MSELDEAIAIANRLLDIPHEDPDSERCIVARQFLRAIERIQGARNLVTNIAQILDVVKSEWGESWSSWDQEQRDRITEFLNQPKGVPVHGGYSGKPLPADYPRFVEPSLVQPKCRFCGDRGRVLDQYLHCKLCVEGMARTNGD